MCAADLRFLADESCDFAIVRDLRAHGYDVLAVSEVTQRSDDHELIEQAYREKCVGCGVCTMTCQTEALKLHRFERPRRPFDTRLEFGMTVAKDNDRL